MLDNEEENEGFVIEEPEDEFALEELTFGPLSKCRSKGEKKRDKFRVQGVEEKQ
ncbi:hypothetical protein PYJP_00640 [Pyrofollis japonicus]|uniref:hypothetical protein n=1 Tax=Pyrofollis japonicus TaxID=3060460 RepID=UPI00295ACA62|nr:hypothetical protein [Pyrofollis japonicus]BEP16712.1 hypothetical protein PYJP_00640 [Pyrofollis japonicus]